MEIEREMEMEKAKEVQRPTVVGYDLSCIIQVRGPSVIHISERLASVNSTYSASELPIAR